MEEKKLAKPEQMGTGIKAWMQFAVIVLAMILFYVAGSQFHLRLDLTGDKRYTLSPQSHEILSGLNNDVYIQVYLDGEMPVQFKKLKRSVRETLDEFRVASGRKVGYAFINPSGEKDPDERSRLIESLLSRGLNPVNIRASDEEGGTSQRIIFPGLIVNYNGIEIPVNFLKNNIALSPEQNLLNSMEGFEYELIQTIATVSSDTVYKVAFIEGHGEMGELEVADITLEMAKYFTVDRGQINGIPGILDAYSAIIIAGPEMKFSEEDKLVIDQYIMRGGKVLWLFEEVNVDEDSLATGETAGLFRPLNLEDQLFKYGVRVNPSLVQDLECVQLPVKIVTGGSQQIVPVPWLYYPLLNPSPVSSLTRNLNRIFGKYVNYIDTVGLDPAIKKTILLTSSPYSRTVNPPVLISLKEAESTPDGSQFNRSAIPVAVMLEGVFRSAYRNRLVGNILKSNDFPVREESARTKMIIIADADVIRNDIRRVGNNESFLPLGQDRYTLQTFGNKEFIINCLNYLVDDYGLMELRGRELKLRLLDKSVIKESKLKILILNVAGPVILVIFAGLIFSFARKRMYTKKRL